MTCSGRAPRIPTARLRAALLLLALILLPAIAPAESAAAPATLAPSAPTPSALAASVDTPDAESPRPDTAPRSSAASPEDTRPDDDGNGPTVADRPAGTIRALDQWFGRYITDPLWDYFLGFPFFTTTAIEVYRGAPATVEDLDRDLARRHGIVTWTARRPDDPSARPDRPAPLALLVPEDQRDRAAGILRARGLQPVEDGPRSRRGGLPLIVLVLVLGGLFFTARWAFINLRLFRHGLLCVLGRYDNPADAGEISHFAALSSALSATIGLGNIAGVAIAIAAGGPGAVFWMWLTAFLGMSVKFTSCTLAQLYRRIGPTGRVLGGPMIFLHDGLAERGPGWRPLAKLLAGAYAVFMICSSFGVALFQSKISYGIAAEVIPRISSSAVAAGFGVALAVLVGVVIIGGIRRIGRVTSRLVPSMCLFYCAACLLIILTHAARVPALLADIFAQAFTAPAVFGGFLGVLVMGLRRGAFSNEAGLGSAAIAHAAARTDEPVREGLVAMLGPFIDTLLVCTMTALTILITGVHLDAEVGTQLEGAVLTATAFAAVHEALGYLLVPAVLIFAYSTMITWSYYGERATEYLLHARLLHAFRFAFVALVVIGPLLSIGNILGFADLMMLSAALPNIIGMVLLSRRISPLVRDYVHRLRRGEIQPAAARE